MSFTHQHPPSTALILLAALTALLSGCINRGPGSIAQQRGPYTEVLAETDKAELLTNIVRLAYLDAPVFLQVSSVTASPSFEYGTESELRLGDGSAPNPLVLAKPKLLMKDAPTIVYKPLLGKEFSSELLMPFDIWPMFLMLDNGFDFSIIAQLLFKSINGVSNYRHATPAQHAEFRRVTEALGRLLQRDEIKLGTPPDGLGAHRGHVVVKIAPTAMPSDDAQFVIQALQLDPTRSEFELRAGLPSANHVIAVSPRSLLALLSFMSNYVEAPAAHTGLVWPSAARADTEPLMRILSSQSRPALADPAIFYKGYWFYVRADDLRSRNTLYLIRLLFNLQAQASAGNDTVQLTLPVK
jgi:hypothetical protein